MHPLNELALLSPNRHHRPVLGKRSSSQLGFTFVEILMAIAIGAAIIGAAVIGYSAMSRASAQRSGYGTVQLGSGIPMGFYEQTGSSVVAYYAPSYGRSAQAEVVREKLYEDISRAGAVYCLLRNDNNRGSTSLRPNTITISADFDPRRLDSPEAFRAFLSSISGSFTPYSGTSDAARNLSIFILGPSQDTNLLVTAIYELDFVTTTSPAGTYASVRRYQFGEVTDYYDVFYQAPSNAATDVPFAPVVAHFGRPGSTVPAGFQRAENRPFYFVWWPDPAVPTLETSGPENSSSAPYSAMGGRTSFFMVIPMFPAL